MTQPLTLLSDEEAAFRDLVADFAAREIEPLRAAMDEMWAALPADYQWLRECRYV